MKSGIEYHEARYYTYQDPSAWPVYQRVISIQNSSFKNMHWLKGVHDAWSLNTVY